MPIPAGHAHVVHQLMLNEDPEPMVVTYGVAITANEPFTPIGVATACHQAFATRLKALISSRYTINQTQVYVGIGGGGGELTAIHVEPIPCTGSAEPIPQNSAYLVKKFTQAAGKRGKGRFFLPGVPETIVSHAGILTAAHQVVVNAALQLFLDDLLAHEDLSGMVLLHNPGVSPAPDLPTAITQLVVDRVIATQRNRLRR